MFLVMVLKDETLTKRSFFFIIHTSYIYFNCREFVDLLILFIQATFSILVSELFNCLDIHCFWTYKLLEGRVLHKGAWNEPRCYLFGSRTIKKFTIYCTMAQGLN